MKVSLADCLLVMAGSACGGLIRHLMASWIPQRAPGGEFPWGILLVNVSGCFLLAYLYSWLSAQPDAWPGWKPLLGVGFLGGYTTFSTLLWDTWRLGPKVGLINLVVSALAGYAAVALGAKVGKGA